jgi:hypothetical protein
MRQNQSCSLGGGYFAPITAYAATHGIVFATVNPREFELDTTDERHSIVSSGQGWHLPLIMIISWEVMSVSSGLFLY